MAVPKQWENISPYLRKSHCSTNGLIQIWASTNWQHKFKQPRTASSCLEIGSKSSTSAGSWLCLPLSTQPRHSYSSLTLCPQTSPFHFFPALLMTPILALAELGRCKLILPRGLHWHSGQHMSMYWRISTQSGAKLIYSTFATLQVWSKGLAPAQNLNHFLYGTMYMMFFSLPIYSTSWLLVYVFIKRNTFLKHFFLLKRA